MTFLSLLSQHVSYLDAYTLFSMPRVCILFIHLWPAQDAGKRNKRIRLSVCASALLPEPRECGSCLVLALSLVPLAAMLNEVRWCHAGQVTFGESSCHWAAEVPQELQSVIIILMTHIALLAMSSLVCVKANEQCPNCKINLKNILIKDHPHHLAPPLSSSVVIVPYVLLQFLNI